MLTSVPGSVANSVDELHLILRLTAIEFTQKALQAIEAREEEMLPRKRPILVSFGCKMPIGLRRQLEKATKKHGIEKTALVLELLSRVLPVVPGRGGAAAGALGRDRIGKSLLYRWVAVLVSMRSRDRGNGPLDRSR
jgi:hypothetical protein